MLHGFEGQTELRVFKFPIRFECQCVRSNVGVVTASSIERYLIDLCLASKLKDKLSFEHIQGIARLKAEHMILSIQSSDCGQWDEFFITKVEHVAIAAIDSNDETTVRIRAAHSEMTVAVVDNYFRDEAMRGTKFQF
eukprot:c1832_g1_i2.p1 GENE.c1832_g1_i2~~c1832_g1_i2.p1  ORF type:complete len:156 (+),score=27.70 c1832_g1_i2:58-468(+)